MNMAKTILNLSQIVELILKCLQITSRLGRERLG
jgi:hypothetical protein